MQKKYYVCEVHCFTDDVLVTDKYFMAHNVQCSIFHRRFLKASALARHLIASAND